MFTNYQTAQKKALPINAIKDSIKYKNISYLGNINIQSAHPHIVYRLNVSDVMQTMDATLLV